MRTQQLFIQFFISFLLFNSSNIALAQSHPKQSPEAQQALQKADRLYFIENKGQWDSDVLYLCQMGGLDAWITKYGVNYTFYKIQNQDPDNPLLSIKEPSVMEHRAKNATLLGHRILFQLEGHNQEPETKSHLRKSGYCNYLIGNDVSKHTLNVGLYKEVEVKNVYDGIDIRYYFDRGFLRFDYIVHAGADPGQIKFALKGSDSEYLKDGALCYTTRFGEVKMAELKTTQNGKEIRSHFIKKGDNWQIDIAAYDKKHPLIIDPLVYSTFIGGSHYDLGVGIALDPSGNTYITGYTYSADYDTTSGAFQTNSSGDYDTFVTKLNADGTALLYSTYIGGSKEDVGFGIALDASGNAYITGYTGSTDYNITSGAFQTTHGGGIYDTFVTKMNADGTALLYSTYIGGSSDDQGNGIAVDATGNAYIAGCTTSDDYNITSGAFQATHEGAYDAYLTKLNTDGTALLYSTYIGGNGNDKGNGIVLDASGNAYMTGATFSTDYDITSGTFQTTLSGVSDAFVTKMNADGTALLYSTYIGGSSHDGGYGIALDASDNAYITGYTFSDDYDISSGAIKAAFGGGDYDAVITKLNSDGTALIYSTYIGGSHADAGYGIVLDASRNAYVIGDTYSDDYDITSGAFQTTQGGYGDAFVTIINADGSALLYSTYIGGSINDRGNGIALDASGNAYITGYTTSTDYDITSGAFQTTHGGGNFDAFVTKIGGIPLSLVHFDSDIPDFQISPNPAHGDFKLHFASKQHSTYHIAMYDNMGQLVFQQDYLSDAGANEVSMSPGNLSQGAYTIHVKDDFGHSVTKKLVITK